MARQIYRVVKANKSKGSDFADVWEKQFRKAHAGALNDSWIGDEGYSPRMVEANLSEQAEGFDVSKYETEMAKARWI